MILDLARLRELALSLQPGDQRAAYEYTQRLRLRSTQDEIARTQRNSAAALGLASSMTLNASVWVVASYIYEPMAAGATGICTTSAAMLCVSLAAEIRARHQREVAPMTAQNQSDRELVENNLRAAQSIWDRALAFVSRSTELSEQADRVVNKGSEFESQQANLARRADRNRD